MPSKYQTRQNKEFVRPYKIHPAWRGIGCLMMVLVPIMAGATAVLVKDIGLDMGWPIMRELRSPIQLPEILHTIQLTRGIANWFASFYYLRAILLFFVLAAIFFSGVMSLLYAIIYRVIGPPQYTPLDAPAPKRKVKRYTR